ncbi:MAG: universal stress protein [Thermoleophilia bacterium]
MTPDGSAQARPAYRHIACCVDRSAASQRALAEATRLWRASGGRLSVVHVARAPLGGYSRWDVTAQPAYQEAEEWLGTVVAELPGAEAVTLWGFPPERVSDWAAESAVDLLVAAAHHGAAHRSILGSFTAGLARRAPCPVLVVRPPAPSAAEAPRIEVTADGGGELRHAGGSGRLDGSWRAEHLMLAAVARGAIDALSAAAAREGFTMTAAATASASRPEGRDGLRDAECEVRATLRPPPPADLCRRLVEEAEDRRRPAGPPAAAPRIRWHVNERSIDPAATREPE